jgi:hypothetical protein
MLGFIKQQERKLALRLLTWHYQRNNMVLPSAGHLREQAYRVVDDAHRIARERGSNVLAIIKELIADIKRDKQEESENRNQDSGREM